MLLRRYQFRGAALGVVLTVLVAVVFSLGWLERFENIALDIRQRRFSRVETDPRIVHVDIDDGSVEQIGRWPDAWPRDLLADLIRTLHEARAAAVAVDLIFDEPQATRFDDPAGGQVSALDSGVSIIGSYGDLNRVYPDSELADAIRRAGNVYLSMRFAFQSDRAVRVRNIVSARPSAGPRDVADQLRTSPAEIAVDWARAKLASAFAADFSLDRRREEFSAAWQPIAAALRNMSVAITPELVVPRAKKDAAEAVVADILRANPDARLDDLLTALRLPKDHFGADRAVLARELDRQLAMREVRARTPRLPPDVPLDRLPQVADLEPPVLELARAAHGFGAVGVQKDADGHVRRVALMIPAGDHALPQLGFAVALDQLHMNLGQAALSPAGLLDIPAVGNAFHVPLDRGNRMILYWSRTAPGWKFNRDCDHIPAAWVLELPDMRKSIQHNQRFADELLDEVVCAQLRKVTISRGKSDVDPVADYESRVAKCRRAKYDLHLKSLEGREESEAAKQLARDVAQWQSDIDRTRKSNAGAVRRYQRQIEAALAEAGKGKLRLNPGETLEQVTQDLQQQRTDIAALVDKLNKVDELQTENATLARRIEARIPLVRQRLEGKLVFLGYTATAVGDIVPTAIDPEMPGVIAHSTVLNSFLQNRFIHVPRIGTEILVILLCGLGATVITATRGYLGTLVAVGTALVGYVALNMLWLFRADDTKVELASVLTVMTVASGLVTFFRWRTADRQKREIRAQLGQYTSPALASRISDDPAAVNLLTRVESREVTCFVSDLKGFTTMAEQVDPERTRVVLNIYLDRMSEVLHRHQALINKFMGDGIFAFFNSSVLPVKSHPREACEAALDCLATLDELRREQRERGGDDLIQQFQMRIGIASGVAGVGDFGSSRKKDYTVIGDVANLAARLEPANKVFGTSLLVSGPTRDECSDAYEFGYLAELQVKGKRRNVPVYELMGRRGSVDPSRLQRAQAFAAGVELYKQRRWDACIAHFSDIMLQYPEQVGATAYIEASHAKKLLPPGPEWSGSLELKEK